MRFGGGSAEDMVLFGGGSARRVVLTRFSGVHLPSSIPCRLCQHSRAALSPLASLAKGRWLAACAVA